MSSAAAKAVDTFASNRAVSRVRLAVAAHAGVTRRARVHEEGSLRVRCPGSPSAELEAMQTIGRQSMLELIDKLSPEQQQVLTLKFVFNFANADVATILEKTEGAIKSLQHRALASLQKQIAQDDQE